MATQQPHQPNPHIPLIASPSQRGETATQDARLINGYVEKLETGSVVAVKRPGIRIALDHPTGSAQGLFYWKGNVYSIADGIVYKDLTNIGSVNTSGGYYTWGSTQGTTPRLFFHNASNAYYYDAGSGIVSIGALAGQTIFSGCAYLDGTMYVLVLPNTILGSGLNDLTTWNAANAIQAQMMPDDGSAIYRMLSYVVVLKQFTTEAFFDAGNPTGSPLQSAQGTFFPYGCRSSGSVQQIEDCLLWVNSTPSAGVTVILLENMRPRIVSTPAVERLLQQLDFTTVYSWNFRLYGHRFYVLTLVNNNLTLVYDITTNEWFQWTDTDGNYMPFLTATTSNANQTYIQHASGDVYVIDGTVGNDGGTVFPFDIYTPNWDGGSQQKKYCHRVDVIADQAKLGKLRIRVSDDDYQTWSNFREVELNKKKRALYNCGTFRKRAWHVQYLGDSPIRVKALELSILAGEG